MSQHRMIFFSRNVRLALVVGFAVRVIALVLVDYNPDRGDAAGYVRLGSNLAAHGRYSAAEAPPFTPSAGRAPAYPFFLAAIYRVVGVRHVVVQVVQLLIGLLTGLLLAHGVTRVAPKLGPPTLWLCMLSPSDAVFNGAILSETLCGLFVVAGIVIPLLSSHRASFFLAGVALGLAALTRDVLLLLPLAVAGVALVEGLITHKLKTRAWIAALLLIGAAVPVGSWTIRNTTQAGRVVVSGYGNVWYLLWIGTWERNIKWMALDDEGLPKFPEHAFRSTREQHALLEAIRQKDNAEREALSRAWFQREIREKPVMVASAWTLRLPNLWVGTRIESFQFAPSVLARGQPLWVVSKGGFYLVSVLVLLLGLAGAAACVAARRRELLPFVIPIAYTQLVHIPFHIESRYAQPVYPFLLVLVAVCLVWLFRFLPNRKDGTTEAAKNE